MLDGPLRPARLRSVGVRCGSSPNRARRCWSHGRSILSRASECSTCARRPGGKSTHIAALMGDEGEVVAVERNRARAAELGATARRLHAHSVRVELADAVAARPEGSVYDRVLIDPPCSGLGTLQARPDLRWRVDRRGHREVGPNPGGDPRRRRQGAPSGRRAGLFHVHDLPAENEQQIERFLDRNSHFALEDLSNEQQSHIHPSMPEALLTMPHRDRTAGFFIARMRRVG